MNKLELDTKQYLAKFISEETKPQSERAEIVGKFIDRINKEREGTKYKPIAARGIAMKVSHIPTKDLWAFYKKCNEYKGGFSRAFFGMLKVR